MSLHGSHHWTAKTTVTVAWHEVDTNEPDRGMALRIRCTFAESESLGLWAGYKTKLNAELDHRSLDSSIAVGTANIMKHIVGVVRGCCDDNCLSITIQFSPNQTWSWEADQS